MFQDVDYTSYRCKMLLLYLCSKLQVATMLVLIKYISTQTNNNGFIRVELLKNNVVEYSIYHKLNIEDEISGTGDEILLLQYDIIISANVGDTFYLVMLHTAQPLTILMSKATNQPHSFSVWFCTLYQATAVPGIQQEYFQIESGHWDPCLSWD
jgi:hypothetical protein